MDNSVKTRSQQKNRGWVLINLSKLNIVRKTDNIGLLAIAVIVGVLMVLPAAFIIFKALSADASVWPKLFKTKIPSLLFSTISLTVSVTFLTILIALPAAWLVTMTDLPGQKVWRWLLAVPLAIPPYIGSFAYITLLGPRGLVQQQISKLLSLPPHQLNIPSIYSFFGTLILMSVFTYPYIFLLSQAAFSSQNQSLIDAARASGMRFWQVLHKVTLPLIRPSIAAGSLLVALYVLSDFGAISLLRYPTFTSVIYQQLTGRYDTEAAAALSIVLMVITIVVIWFELRSRAKARYFQTTGTYRPIEKIKLGVYKWPALAFIALVFIIALLLPLSVLVYWTILGIGQNALDSTFFQYAFNSITVSGIAATLAVFLALPVVYLTTRQPSFLARLVWRLSYAGYALPGVLIGLGMVFAFNSALPFLYGTVVVLILAYVVRFLPQSLQSEESALTAISPNLEEAAKSFGHGIFSILKRISMPLILPAILASWVLIFISSMKELAATLLLRPAGFDTLAVKVWADASEGFYELAAPPALLLVLISAIPLAIITRSRQTKRKTKKPLGSVEDVSSTA